MFHITNIVCAVTKLYSLESVLHLLSCLGKTMRAVTGAKVRHRPNCGGTTTKKKYTHTHTQKNKTGTCNVLLSIVLGRKIWSKMFCGTNQHPCHIQPMSSPNQFHSLCSPLRLTDNTRPFPHTLL